MRGSDLLAAGAVLATTAVLALMPDSEAPPSDETGAKELPVEQTDLVCPPMPASGQVGAAITPPQVDAPGSSSLESNPVRVVSNGSSVARISERGEVWRGDGGVVSDGVLAQVDGALAAGLSGVVSADLDDDRVAGQATATCVTPSSSWWFVGAGSSVGRSDTLVLSNASPGVAVVDLAFHGPDGPLDVENAQVSLDSGARQELPLEDFVAGESDVAVSVSVRQGRVAAAMSETLLDAFEPVGADFIPAAAEPDREVSLTGMPSGAGSRELVVVNTGQSETVVDVEVMGATGAFQPSNFEVLRVPPGAVVTRDVSAITREEASGLRLSAEEPISASVRVGTSGPDDVAYAAAAHRLSEVAVAPLPADVRPVLVLSAVNDSSATADVTVYDASGEQVAERSLELGGGQTTTWSVEGRGAAAVVVSSDDGEQLIGSVRWQGDGGESITPLQPLQTTLSQPPLAYDVAGP